MAVDNRNGTAVTSPVNHPTPADERGNTGVWSFSLQPPLKREGRQGGRKTMPLALQHLGDNAKCGVFLADTNGGQTPTHLGIGFQVADEILQHLADKHGFLLHQLIGFRDAPSQAAADANARGAA